MRTRLFHIYIAAGRGRRRKVVSFRNCKSFHLVRGKEGSRGRRLGCHFSWIDEQKRWKTCPTLTIGSFSETLLVESCIWIWLKNSLSRNSRLMPVQVFKAMYLNIPRNTFDCRESLMVSQVTLKKFISTWISKDSSTSLSLMKIRHKNSTWEYPLLSLVHYEFKP